MKLLSHISILILFAVTATSPAMAEIRDDFEAGQPVINPKAHFGLYLGRCEGQIDRTDALLWGQFTNSKGAAKALAIPASLISQKNEILNNILDERVSQIFHDDVREERDRNGNPFMYRYISVNRNSGFEIHGVYQHGINPCTRELPPGNPDRIICNPPILHSDRGFGLAPMEDLTLSFRTNLSGNLVSKMSYVQDRTPFISYCEWTHRVGSGL